MKKGSSLYDCENDLPFRKVYESHYRNLCFFAYQLLGDREIAKDVVQDSFVAYWNQKDTISNNERIVKSYLYSTVKFISLNNLRHKKVTERFSMNSSDPYFENEQITDKIMRAEVLRELYHALNMLPEGCKEIFRLGYLEGFSNSKIAQVLEISINTVKTQKQRGFKILRSVLRPEVFFLFLLIFI